MRTCVNDVRGNMSTLLALHSCCLHDAHAEYGWWPFKERKKLD